MSDEKKSKSNEQVEIATNSQVLTVKQLYDELDYPKNRRYENKELKYLSKKDAGVHIEALIKLKRCAKGNGNVNASGFDKIGYSMIYKLVYREWNSLQTNAALKDMSFSEVVLQEFLKYKNAIAKAEEYVKGSGQ